MKRSEKRGKLQEDGLPAVTGFTTSSPHKSREKLSKQQQRHVNQSEESLTLDEISPTHKNRRPAPPKRRRSTDQIIPEDEQVEIFDESSSNSSERESLGDTIFPSMTKKNKAFHPSAVSDANHPTTVSRSNNL